MHRLSASLLVVCAIVTTLAAAPARADTIVHFHTNLGDFDAVIYDTPAVTSANFLNYVESGAYTDTVFHRAIPGVIQGGIYYFPDPGHLNFITPSAAIPLEYGRPNIRGSLAMARTSNPNSATTSWFINVTDNSTAYAPGGVDPNGYAVFGQVISGLDVVDAIAAVPIYNATAKINSDFATVPLLQPFVSYDTLVRATITVPEPASAMLLPFAAAGLLAQRRRR